MQLWIKELLFNPLARIYCAKTRRYTLKFQDEEDNEQLDM